ncbi:hypothetical protein L1049_015232 [Liquidambar formosana]|uniref:Protein kinase domain-containing protein n=1 Tax=Liquidambar formosana TaxID=63359 RepID=A0AAP0RXS1_LIQFO
MGPTPRIQVCLLLLFFVQILAIAAETDNQDFVALTALEDMWQNSTPPTWVGSDPCGNGWDGIKCTKSRVTAITLPSMGLTGQLSGDIEGLSELQSLDLSYNKGLTGSLPSQIGSLTNLSNLILVGCSFSGLIPDMFGSLKQLTYLSLNSNRFIGKIPPSIGNLSNLYWLDLAENQLTGTIPVSNKVAPGLDMLVHARHFHFGKNQLSGTIPSQLFSSNMSLIHVLFEMNRLNGSIPSTLGLVQSLEVVRLDRNFLSGPVPSNLNNLTNVSQLFLSNNKLTGPVPNLTGMNLLHSVDMSNNSFDTSDVPQWFLTSQSLTTLIMEKTQLQGKVPEALFSLPNLQTVVLRNNQLNGTLDIGTSRSNYLQLIDLQANFIDDYRETESLNIELILVGNPVCEETNVPEKYCKVSQTNLIYSTDQNNCMPVLCSSGQISSPNCKCACPYSGTLVFRAPSFSDLKNSSRYISLEHSLMLSFQTDHLPVDSVSLSNLRTDPVNYLELRLEVFPYGQNYFNRSGILNIGFVMSNQTFKPPKYFGPFYFLGDEYGNFAEGSMTSNKSLNIGIIIGAAAGGSVLVLLLLLAVVYAFCQKRRAERATTENNPFASWDSNKGSGSIPQLKGARCFSFEVLNKCTDKFSEASELGSGGYGKVYKGTLSTGELVAIKRAQQGSTQGALEFKTEIELLSRVHHKNVVSLLGFCFDQGEQMLVYEYVPNGTLKDSLSGIHGS